MFVVVVSLSLFVILLDVDVVDTFAFVEGNVIERNDLQKTNAFLPSTSNRDDSSNITDVSDIQLSNAFCPILFTEDGITIDSNETKELNVELGIFFIYIGKSMECKLFLHGYNKSTHSKTFLLQPPNFTQLLRQRVYDSFISFIALHAASNISYNVMKKLS